MKNIIFSLLLVFTCFSYPQTIYDVTPGTKGNQIIITLENESKVSEAKNVEVKLINSPTSLAFQYNNQIVKMINACEEKDVPFLFDIKRNVKSNKKDTIEFVITGEGINLKKSFIINYTAPKEYALSQNFPNPFNPTTTIRYDLPIDSKVTIKIYDILGNEVKTLVDQNQSAGYKEIRFNGASLASGVYIYRMIANNPGRQNFVSIKKMMMVK
ncbi:MAG: T9SS type A sorting domain-containing protein [Ignavibacteriaceae bacterium]